MVNRHTYVFGWMKQLYRWLLAYIIYSSYWYTNDSNICTYTLHFRSYLIFWKDLNHWNVPILEFHHIDCIIRILYCWNELILHCWNATILQYWNEVVLILHFRTEQMFLFMRDILILQFKLLHKNLFLRQVLWRGLLFLLLWLIFIIFRNFNV